MFFKKTKQHENSKNLIEIYSNFRSEVEEFTLDSGISSRILGGYDETKQLNYELLLIESYMATVVVGVASIQKNHEKNYLKYVSELFLDRKDKIEVSFKKVSENYELIESKILKARVCQMLIFVDKFLHFVGELLSKYLK